LEEKIAAIASFRATAVANNSTWPFVTIDQFQQRSASSRSLSGCLSLNIAPIVTNETRLAWEEYSVANSGWLTEGQEYQAEKGLGADNGFGSTRWNPVINPQILSSDESGVMVDPGVRIWPRRLTRIMKYPILTLISLQHNM
jgi:hypothetical protein